MDALSAQSAPQSNEPKGEDYVVLPAAVFEQHGTAQNYVAWLEQKVKSQSAPQEKRRKFELTPEMRKALAKASETHAQVAEMPNGGVMFINYGDQPEDTSDLDCPYCGGSGHKADVRVPKGAIGFLSEGTDDYCYFVPYDDLSRVSFDGIEVFAAPVQATTPDVRKTIAEVRQITGCFEDAVFRAGMESALDEVEERLGLCALSAQDGQGETR